MAKNKNILDKIIEQTLKKPAVPGIPSVNNLSPTANFDAQYKLLQGKKYVPDPGLMKPEDVHNILTIASVVTLFIPLVGPAISAGISLNNAELYAKEGKTYEAGLEATFALIPGLGKLAKLTGVVQLGKQGMKTLAGKLIAIKSGKQVTLDATEKLALKSIAANKQLVETEVKKGLAKRVATGSGKAAAQIGADVLTAAAYDKIYLKVAGTTLDDWLTKWWDDWLMNPVLESTNIYQDIVNQIKLNEQTTSLKNAAAMWDNETAPGEEPQSGWSKTWDNLVNTGKTVVNNPIAQTAGGIVLGALLLRIGGRFLGRKISNFFSGGKLTTAGAKKIAANLDEYGLKLLAKGLQEERTKIFQSVAAGTMTREEALKVFETSKILPKKYLGLGTGRKKLIKTLDNQVSANVLRTSRVAKETEKSSAETIKAAKDVEAAEKAKRIQALKQKLDIK
jgi:hypothetical protein